MIMQFIMIRLLYLQDLMYLKQLSMFQNARSFIPPLDNFDTRYEFSMEGMFKNSCLFYQELNWDTSNVENMYDHFTT